MVSIDRPYAPSNAGLSLFWPGLAQLCQRRYGVAALFSIETAAACALFAMDPAVRAPATGAVVILTMWSMLDAWWAERRQRKRR